MLLNWDASTGGVIFVPWLLCSGLAWLLTGRDKGWSTDQSIDRLVSLVVRSQKFGY